MADQDTSYRWHRWSVKGTKDQLLRLLEHLDGNLPIGWRKLTGDESPLPTPLAPDAFTGYRSNPRPGKCGITLVIDLSRDVELRGGRMFGTFPSAAAERAGIGFAGQDVDRFLDEGLLPAAAAAGLQVRKGTVADILLEELPYDVRERLNEFDRVASRKTLPLDWAESEAWQAFVVAAKRSATIFEDTLMRDWFVANGWSEAAAESLTAEFFEQLRLLARYHDSLVIA